MWEISNMIPLHHSVNWMVVLSECMLLGGFQILEADIWLLSHLCLDDVHRFECLAICKAHKRLRCLGHLWNCFKNSFHDFFLPWDSLVIFFLPVKLTVGKIMQAYFQHLPLLFCNTHLRLYDGLILPSVLHLTLEMEEHFSMKRAAFISQWCMDGAPTPLVPTLQYILSNVT